MAEKLTVFISGTMRDLPTERERVAATIRKMGLEPVWAEKRGATDRPSRDECERMARTCHVYLGLYGLSYGKFPPEETISATELEWQTAKRAGKPMLIYRQKGQPDPEQAAFLEKVGDWQRGSFWYEFETLDDLLPRLRDDLARLITESFHPERPALLADFRAHLCRLYAGLPLSGIPVPLDVTLPLDRVYIKLRALPEQEEAARRKAALPPDHDEDLPRWLAERLWRRWEEGEEAASHLKETQPIPPEEAIARHDRLAVLGEAGAGKSTLLRHLAWERAADPKAPLPLLTPLGRADALISQTGCSFLEAVLDLLTEHKASEEREALKRALEDAIRDNKVFFLCDGLDEAHLARRSVVTGLEKLAADGQRLVVTSRPLGYERLTGLEHFHVLPLLPEDAQAFSERWFRALAAARRVPKAKRGRWAADRAGWLQRQLDERPSLREVARNPLLLTFLAVLAGDDPQRDLPARRKELYREYMERLFTVWEARRRWEGELSLGRLRGEEARHVALWGLYRTAWHLHRAYYGEEGLRAVREEIEPLLARDLAERWEFGALQAEALASEVLRFWEGAGLLDVYRLAGQEWLAFRHLTFQEYGAARALVQMPPDVLWAVLRPRLHDPYWREVISLTAAILPDASNFIRQILGAGLDDSLETRVHHHLLLAAACLSEGTSVECDLLKEIVSNLEVCLSSAIPHLCDEAAERLINIGKAQARDTVIQVAFRYTSHSNPWTCELAVSILAELEASSEAAIDVYSAYIQEIVASEQEGRFISSNRRHKTLLTIVNLLGKLKSISERAVAVLVELGGYEHVSLGVLGAIPGSLVALGRSDLASEILQRIVHPFAAIDWQKQLRQQREAEREFFLMIAKLLCEDDIQVNSGVDLAELQNFLAILDFPEWPMTWIYKIARGQIGLYGKQVLHIAATLLGVDKGTLAAQARAAAQAVTQDKEERLLSQLLEGSKQTTEQIWPSRLASSAIATLIDALGDDPEWVRYTAAGLLINSPGDEWTIGALNQVLESSNSTRARILSARILGFMKRSDTQIIRNLTAALRDDTDRQMRAAAAEALGNLENSPPNAIKALIQGWYAEEPSAVCTHCGAILTPEQSSCPECHIVTATSRESIIRALGKIAKPDSDVIEIMISALQHPDWGIKRAAEEATTSLYDKEPQFVSKSLVAALWQLAKTEVDLKGFAETVTRICSQYLPATSTGHSTSLAEEWFSLLRHPSPLIRKAAISCLSNLQSSHHKVTSALIALLSDQDKSVRDAAYQALRMGVGNIMGTDRQPQLGPVAGD